MSTSYLQMLARMPGRRDALLRELTDIFLETQRTAHERELFDEVADEVLDFVDAQARQQLAARLGARRDAPRRVVTRLAGDAIAIAAPLLRHSPVLTDDDLAMLAGERSQDHLLAIARRASLAAPVTDVLIVRGEADVLEAVAENPGARFSEPGAAALIEKARGREGLWSRLARRVDLAVVDAAPGPAADAPGRPLDAILDDIAGGALGFGDAVIALADGDRIADLAVLLSGRLAIDFAAFVHELFAPSEMRLVHRCCEARLDLDSFSAVMRLRKRRYPLGAETISRILRAHGARRGSDAARTPSTL